MTTDEKTFWERQPDGRYDKRIDARDEFKREQTELEEMNTDTEKRQHTNNEIKEAAYDRMLELLRRIDTLPIVHPPHSESDWDCGVFLDFDLTSAVADLLTAIRHPEEDTAKKVLWNKQGGGGMTTEENARMLVDMEVDVEEKAIKAMLDDATGDSDSVNHPRHYTSHPSGVECIEITKHYDFCVGNAIKYLWRAGLKHEDGMSDRAKEVEDLRKAAWYIAEKIKMLEGGK